MLAFPFINYCPKVIRMLALVATLSPTLDSAQRLEVEIPLITAIPIIDGSIEEDEWQEAAAIQVNIEVDPGDNIEAEVTAQALIMEEARLFMSPSEHRIPSRARYEASMRIETAAGTAIIWS